MNGPDNAVETRGRTIDRVLPPLIILCVVLAVWQGAVRLLDVPPWLLPAPTDVAEALWQQRDLLFWNT